MRIEVTGLTMTFTPPATARSHSPRAIAAQAWWNATSDEEQAVSSVRHGPLQSNV